VTLALDNPFWTFSLKVYAAEGVQAECLALQEQYGLDVNLLLFCAYAGAVECVALSMDDVASVAAAVEGWHKDVVRPLRHARRALKAHEPDAAPLRTNVKRSELEAEQIEQAMIWAWARQNLEGRDKADQRDAVINNIRLLLH
jgi:uncharacterized protein (TIGR02444 family)